MSEENRCPQCGAALPAQSPQGLCPGCLLKWGLESQTGGEETGSQPAAADRPPPTPEELAAYFPDLEILELVGRGGMGVVYKARQKRLDRLVALKILAPKIGQEPAFAERFTREARAMAMLSHPHIVAVHDFGQATLSPRPLAGEGPGVRAAGAGTPLYHFLMEFVDGVNLRRLLDTGKLAPEEALAIVPQICEALQYAHDHGVVHRDIKPENVLLDKEGRVKIADFGIAKLVGKEAKDLTLTGAGQIVGTPQYMAPEQMEHPLQVDHRADIYSLGVVFYQMLTGELPIGRFAPPSKKVQIDVRLDEVVLRALEKEPERRYQQASEIKTQVESIVTTPDASGEAAGREPAAGRVSKVSKCYLSTPEHLRSLRGRCLYLFKAKGELRLDDQTLSFRSSWPAIVIPLSSIRKIGQGDFPYSAKPLPLEYIAVTYTEHGVQRTVLFAPFAGALLPTTANENVEQWLSALQEAIRTRTGQTLPVERPWLAQDRFSTARMLLLSAATLAGAIIVFTTILTLANERRLPNAGELWFGPVFAVISTLFTFVALWERRRRAIAAGNLDALSAPSSVGGLGANDDSHSAIADAGTIGGIPANQAATEEARRQVKGPAIGLLIVGMLTCLFVPMIAPYANLCAVPAEPGTTPPARSAIDIFLMIATIIAFLLVTLFPGVLMIVAAVKMKRLRAYWLAVVAGILAIILSCAGFFVGLPIGIWALVVLSQRDVRTAFGHRRQKSKPVLKTVDERRPPVRRVFCVLARSERSGAILHHPIRSVEDERRWGQRRWDQSVSCEECVRPSTVLLTTDALTPKNIPKGHPVGDAHPTRTNS